MHTDASVLGFLARRGGGGGKGETGGKQGDGEADGRGKTGRNTGGNTGGRDGRTGEERGQGRVVPGKNRGGGRGRGRGENGGERGWAGLGATPGVPYRFLPGCVPEHWALSLSSGHQPLPPVPRSVDTIFGQSTYEEMCINTLGSIHPTAEAASFNDGAFWCTGNVWDGALAPQEDVVNLATFHPEEDADNVWSGISLRAVTRDRPRPSLTSGGCGARLPWTALGVVVLVGLGLLG